MCTKQKERDAGDEDTESNRERGNEIKKFQKKILQTQNLGRTVNREGVGMGIGEREKSATMKRKKPKLYSIPLLLRQIQPFYMSFLKAKTLTIEFSFHQPSLHPYTAGKNPT